MLDTFLSGVVPASRSASGAANDPELVSIPLLVLVA